MKIIYLIAGLYRPAGMERVICRKANWLSAHGHEVMIVTTEQQGRPLAFPLESGIRTIDLAIGYESNNGKSFINKAINYPLKQLRHRRRLSALLQKENVDIVISTFCNEAAFLPGIKDGSAKVLETHFSRNKRLQYGRSGLWRAADWIRKAQDNRTIQKYARFVTLTREDAALWGHRSNMAVIANPRTFSCSERAQCTDKQIIAVGRYTAQKGFDMLLEAWSRIEHDGWTLRLCGQGELNFEGKDVVTGPCTDVRAEMLRSSIFALSSRYEGLPMALLEAQAAGLPSVCFKCQCGPSDVITDSKDGFLVQEGDIQGFADRLKTLMDFAELRSDMGAAAYANSENYDIEKIMPQWEKLLKEL